MTIDLVNILYINDRTRGAAAHPHRDKVYHNNAPHDDTRDVCSHPPLANAIWRADSCYHRGMRGFLVYAKCIGPFSLNVYSSYLHLAYMYSATAHSHWCVNLNIPDDNVRKSEEAEKSRARRSNGSAIKLTGPRLRRSVEQTANYQTDRRFSRWEPE